VTKYSTIRGVFQHPWPGVSPTAILNEEKALGTRLADNQVCLKRLYKQNKALVKIPWTKAPKVRWRSGKGRSKEQNVGIKNQYQTIKK